MEVSPEFQGLLALNTRLFNDPDKDVTFRLKDGLEFAHSCVLKASSSVFEAMLTQDMKEKAEKSIELPDVDKATMRVFLRLIYTGHVDPSDWKPNLPAEPVQLVSTIKGVLRQTNVSAEWPRLTASNTSWNNNVLLDADDQFGFEFSVHSEDWKLTSVMIGIAAKDADLDTDTIGPLFRRVRSFFAYASGGTFTRLYDQDATSNKAILGPWPTPLNPGSVITAKFQRTPNSALLFFSVDDCPPVQVSFNQPIPPNFAYAPALAFYGPSSVVISSPKRSDVCPLEMLFDLALLGRKYLINTATTNCVKAMQSRLVLALKSNDIDAYDKILSLAIKADLGPIRFFALEKAKDFKGLRARYDSQQLSPEVFFELQGLWPQPAIQVEGWAKRVKLA